MKVVWAAGVTVRLMPDLYIERHEPALPEEVRGRAAAGREPSTWVVLDLAGDYPALNPGNPLAALLNRQETLEGLTARLERLERAEWLHGVLVRFGAYGAGLATSRAIRDALARLSEHKRTVAFVSSLGMPNLLAASGAGEIVSPESAEVNVLGLGMEVTYLGAFLKRHGVTFENLRIREYKSALTRFSDDQMDPHNREQLTRLLDSMEGSWAEDLAAARGLSVDAVRGWRGSPGQLGRRGSPTAHREAETAKAHRG